MLSVLAQGGGGGGGNIPWPTIFKWAVIALFIGASAISWLIKKLNEQAAIKRAKEARDRQRDEALRTGRPPALPEGGTLGTPPAHPVSNFPVSEGDARRRLQELAQRRRAELERLARQQGGGVGTAGPDPTPGPSPTLRRVQSQRPPFPAQRMAPTEPPRRTVPPVMRPRPAPMGAPQRAARPPKAQRTARAREQAQLEAQRREGGARQREERRTPAQQPSLRAYEEETTHRTVTDAPAEIPMPAEPQPALSAAALRSAPLSDFRKAFVLSVVLRPPVAMPGLPGPESVFDLK